MCFSPWKHRLPRYLLHRYADSFTCYCQAHTQVFQLLPNRKLNLFSTVFFVTHTFPFFASLSRTFFSIERYKKAPRAVCGSSSASFDDMILTHFCSVCIRVFRHGRDGCACRVVAHLFKNRPHLRSPPSQQNHPQVQTRFRRYRRFGCSSAPDYPRFPAS